MTFYRLIVSTRAYYWRYDQVVRGCGEKEKFDNLCVCAYTHTHTDCRYLEPGGLDQVAVLVARADREFGRPSAPHFGRGQRQLARVRFDDGLRLKPSGQPAAGRVRRARHEFSQKTVFVPVHAANNKTKRTIMR